MIFHFTADRSKGSPHSADSDQTANGDLFCFTHRQPPYEPQRQQRQHDVRYNSKYRNSLCALHTLFFLAHATQRVNRSSPEITQWPMIRSLQLVLVSTSSSQSGCESQT